MILHLVCQESEGLGPSKLNLWHGTLSRTQAPCQVSTHSAPLCTELANKDLAASQTKRQLGWDLPDLAALTTPAVPQSFLTPKDKLNTKITSYFTLDFLATKWYQFKPLTKNLCQSLLSMLRVIADKLELIFKGITECKDEREHANQLILLDWHQGAAIQSPKSLQQCQWVCTATV